MLQKPCWFYFSDIKPSIITNQKVPNISAIKYPYENATLILHVCSIHAAHMLYSVRMCVRMLVFGKLHACGTLFCTLLHTIPHAIPTTILHVAACIWHKKSTWKKGINIDLCYSYSSYSFPRSNLLSRLSWIKIAYQCLNLSLIWGGFTGVWTADLHIHSQMLYQLS